MNPTQVNHLCDDLGFSPDDCALWKHSDHASLIIPAGIKSLP